MNLRLLGAPTLKDVVPGMVDASNIHSHMVAVPSDRLYDGNCEFPRPFWLITPDHPHLDVGMQGAQLRKLKSKM
jgi:L-lactate dehydrogenase (cytochrome)